MEFGSKVDTGAPYISVKHLEATLSDGNMTLDFMTQMVVTLAILLVNSLNLF